jgi:hypothetical protein
MYYIKFIEIVMRHCKTCRIITAQEKCDLYYEHQNSNVRTKLMTVYKCLGCDYLHDSNDRILSVEYEKME